MPSLPRQILIEPRVEHHALTDPAGTLRQRLDATWRAEDWAGRRVVVGVGSRGIDRVAEMARTLVGWLRQQGAEPIVMPAMGSHGGGTPEGQRELLASYGVTEHAIDAPIDASMDVVEVGQQVEGVRVVVSARALNADAVVLLNRIKPHTDFGSARHGQRPGQDVGHRPGQGRRRVPLPLGGGHARARARAARGVAASCSATCRGCTASVWSKTGRIASRSSSRCAAPSSTSGNPRCWPRRVPGCRCCRSPKSTCSSSTRSARTSAARAWTPTSSAAAWTCSRCPTAASAVSAIYVRGLDAGLARQRHRHRHGRHRLGPAGRGHGQAQDLHQRRVGDDAGHGARLDSLSDGSRVPAGRAPRLGRRPGRAAHRPHQAHACPRPRRRVRGVRRGDCRAQRSDRAGARPPTGDSTRRQLRSGHRPAGRRTRAWPRGL